MGIPTAHVQECVGISRRPVCVTGTPTPYVYVSGPDPSTLHFLGKVINQLTYTTIQANVFLTP